MLDRIRALCKERGITVRDLENTLGFSNGTIGHWKTSKPKYDKLILVTNYFGVSVDYLTGASDEKSPPQGDGLTDMQRKVVEMVRGMTDAECEKLIEIFRLMQK